MKQKQRNLQPSTSSWINSFVLLAVFVVFEGVAHADAKNNLLTQSDIQRVLRTHSTGPCDVPTFLQVSKELGLEPVWSEYDDLEKHPLSDLSRDSLCLIALSSSFEAYQTVKSKSGHGSLVSAGPENTFPSDRPVTEVVFSLPRSLSAKSCVTLEGATAPYVITIRRANGKLVRDIRRTDSNEECFVSSVQKRGMGTK